MTITDLDSDACYRALSTRDARFDGRFYTAVLTTGVYCRPICPVPPPKRQNCAFYPSAAAAQAAGFRPCRRCRPEVAPGVAGWRGTASTVNRALGLIAEGALDGAGVEALAGRLGLGGRHLRRLFDRHLGAAPRAVAQAQRALFAGKLIAETAMPLAHVADAAGFGSVRRFNEVMLRVFGRPPGALRRGRAAADGLAVGSAVTLRLPVDAPYDWAAIVGFLGTRAIPGVETVSADGRYRRTVGLPDGTRGTVAVGLAGGTARPHLLAEIRLTRMTALPAVVARLRRLFDLDADPAAIAGHLAADRRLAPLVAARPGLRVPGAWDGFELAVRAVLGQQVSVAAARTLAGRLAASYGEPVATAEATPNGDLALRTVFPEPAALAGRDLTAIGLTRARAAALAGLAAAMAADPDLLHPHGSLEETERALARLPGIGPWTAQYMALRALRETDAFPASDLGLIRAWAALTGGARPSPAELARVAEAWRPWRAYAALHLWTSEAAPAPARERAA